MPELPEVETLRRDLIRAGIIGRRIEDVDIFNRSSIRDDTPEAFRSHVRGTRFVLLSRRGKYLRFDLDSGGSILTHLRMTGGLKLSEDEGRADSHDRVRFHLDKGRLIFHDTRKFGRLFYTERPGEVLDLLGPEPFSPELTVNLFFRRLTRHRRAIKPLLLDQGFLAGLGNIYVDESLFAAGIHPTRKSASLGLAEAEGLLTSIRQILTRAIENRGTSLGDGESNFSSGGLYGTNARVLQVFRRTGEPCPRCGSPIERMVLAQRASHFCPRCQPV